MPTSTRNETRAAAEPGRGATAPLPREGRRDETNPPSRHRMTARGGRPVIGLVLMTALAGALFTWSLDTNSTTVDTTGTEALRTHLDDHPDDAVAWRQLGDLYLVDATAADDIAHYLSAVEALEVAVTLDSASLDTTRSLAVASVGLHRFDEAAGYADLVLVERPDDRVALAAMVDAQIELGHYDEATRTADRLAGLRPDAVSLSRLSYVSQLTGDLDAAIDSMYTARTAAQGSPAMTARLSIFLAELHRLRGERSLAADFYREALNDDQAAGRAVVGLAQLAAGDGDVDEARRLLEEPGVANTGLTALQTTARLEAVAGNDAARLQALEQVRAVVDGSIAADIGVDASEVLLEADIGDLDRAARLAGLVLEAQPDSVHAHHAAAWVAHLEGDLAAADHHIDLALRTGLRDPLVLAHAALIRHATGDDAGAAALLSEATAIDPGVIRAYDGLSADLFHPIDPNAGEATS